MAYKLDFRPKKMACTSTPQFDPYLGRSDSLDNCMALICHMELCFDSVQYHS